jgi:hypothetical protein
MIGKLTVLAVFVAFLGQVSPALWKMHPNVGGYHIVKGRP